MDCGDILYYQIYNEIINSELKSIQYDATLAITGAIEGASRSKLYKELGLQCLKLRRTLKHLCAIYKIVSTCLATYFFNLIPQSTHAYQTRTSSNVPIYQSLGLILLNIIFFLGLLLNGTKYFQISEMHLS